MTNERLRRWRLILGSDEADGINITLSDRDKSIDAAMAALYDADADSGGGQRRGGLNASSPSVARWLGDIRTYFPASIVQVMQKDALERLNLQRMLLEPELLQTVEPDVNLVSSLMSLGGVIPQRTKATARLVVRKVVDDLMKRLAAPTRQAVSGALARSVRNRRPRHAEIDWHRTIRANLRHYQQDYNTIIPETRIGYGRKRASMRDVILCIDQSGSMANSIVYSSIFAAVMASMPTISTRMVVFDTSVVDLTDKLADPVDVLFGVQLGGGTDINRALTYCQGLVRRPTDTIMVLISDLIEGGDQTAMHKRVASIVSSGVQLITLLALSDEGSPCFDHANAAALAALGSPAFACTPDKFPDLMATALTKRDVAAWAAANQIVTSRAE